MLISINRDGEFVAPHFTCIDQPRNYQQDDAGKVFDLQTNTIRTTNTTIRTYTLKENTNNINNTLYTTTTQTRTSIDPLIITVVDLIIIDDEPQKIRQKTRIDNKILDTLCRLKYGGCTH